MTASVSVWWDREASPESHLFIPTLTNRAGVAINAGVVHAVSVGHFSRPLPSFLARLSQQDQRISQQDQQTNYDGD